MAKGGRTNLADLVSATGKNSVIDGENITPKPVTGGETPPAPQTSAPLTELAANPRNPREELGDLSELESIATTQLQPALVVTREAYLSLYPEDEPQIDAARWVVINGCRRLAAAHKFGRPDLEFVVKNEIAASRVTLLAAAISENVDRRDFDVIEEARAVEAMVTECGTAELAAQELQKSPGWVSQRRALLQLEPELQAALRRGDLAIRDARVLARVPRAEQVERWLQTQEPKPDTGDRQLKDRTPADADSIAKSLKKLAARPDTLAVALVDYLDSDQLQKLVDSLTATLAINDR